MKFYAINLWSIHDCILNIVLVLCYNALNDTKTLKLDLENSSINS